MEYEEVLKLMRTSRRANLADAYKRIQKDKNKANGLEMALHALILWKGEDARRAKTALVKEWCQARKAGTQ